MTVPLGRGEEPLRFLPLETLDLPSHCLHALILPLLSEGQVHLGEMEESNCLYRPILHISTRFFVAMHWFPLHGQFSGLFSEETLLHKWRCFIAWPVQSLDLFGPYWAATVARTLGRELEDLHDATKLVWDHGRITWLICEIKKIPDLPFSQLCFEENSKIERHFKWKRRWRALQQCNV